MKHQLIHWILCVYALTAAAVCSQQSTSAPPEDTEYATTEDCVESRCRQAKTPQERLHCVLVDCALHATKRWLDSDHFTKKWLDSLHLHKRLHHSSDIQKKWLDSDQFQKKWLDSDHFQKKWLDASQFHKKWLDASQFRKKWLDSSQFQKKWLDPSQFQKKWLDSSQYQKKWLDASQFKKKWLDSDHFQKKWLDSAHFQKRWPEAFQFQKKWLDPSQFQKKWLDTAHFEKKWLDSSHLKAKRLLGSDESDSEEENVATEQLSLNKRWLDPSQFTEKRQAELVDDNGDSYRNALTPTENRQIELSDPEKKWLSSEHYGKRLTSSASPSIRCGDISCADLDSDSFDDCMNACAQTERRKRWVDALSYIGDTKRSAYLRLSQCYAAVCAQKYAASGHLSVACLRKCVPNFGK